MNKAFQPILKKIKKFRDERDWMQFHNPKEMAEAIVIESSELLEQFLWKKHSEVNEHIKNKKNKEEIADELADILTFTIELADNLGLDIEEIISKKISKNSKKYPIEKAKGKAIKYTKL